jgi:3-oxoacyl-[acyl-carrier protein] reductase
MNLGLKDSAAIVTGGSRGIGRAVALELAQEGARVAIAARNEETLRAAENELQQISSRSFGVTGDVSTAEGAGSVMRRCLERLGGADVLIVNSGGPPAGSFDDLDDKAWHKAIELTFMSAVRLIREALPSLEAGRGSVVTIQSISVRQPIPGLILSNALRPAVIGLVKTLSQELATRGVRLNNILPGHIATDRALELAANRAGREGRRVEEVLAEQARSIPLGRIGEPAEIGRLAAFLASPAASYITGASILCDGGLHAGLL